MKISAWVCLIATLVFGSVPSESCSFPQEYQGSWTDSLSNAVLTIGSSNISGFSLNAEGTTISTHNCISQTENIFIVEGDKSYSSLGSNKWLVMCIQITKVSNNLLYFSLLGDRSSSVTPLERVYISSTGTNDLAACSYCSYTDSASTMEMDIRVLTKQGSSEIMTETPKFCDSCKEDCNSAAWSPNGPYGWQLILGILVYQMVFQ